MPQRSGLERELGENGLHAARRLDILQCATAGRRPTPGLIFARCGTRSATSLKRSTG